MIYPKNYINKFLTTIGLIDRPDYYTVQKHPSGYWIIYDEDGFGVGSYTRRRDAIRGAERAGYTLI